MLVMQENLTLHLEYPITDPGYLAGRPKPTLQRVDKHWQAFGRHFRAAKRGFAIEPLPSSQVS